MSYLVLARKWRPRTFDEVVGQEPVVRTLRNGLARDRVPHAMLFSGVRGVGKTTLARIMAKALNCANGPTADPCNTCPSCTTIAEGTAVDLHEIDGASNRGIQEIRELKENIRFFPTRDRFKIIIIDEVHMLTTEAFNALLKTLEEPPAHVYFMFATTELHKIPITILSRCQRYELRRVPSRELSDFFSKIAAAENVDIADRALDLIVREAEGSVRDGLSLLDQILSFAAPGDGDAVQQVSLNDVTQVLGLVDSRALAGMAETLLAGNMAGSLEQLDALHATGVDLKRFAVDLLGFFRALLLCKVSGAPEKLLDVAEQDMETMRHTAAAHSVEELHRIFYLLMQAIEQMHYSSHPRLVLETALMGGAQAGGVVPLSDVIARLDSLLAGHGGAVAVAPAPAPVNSRTHSAAAPVIQRPVPDSAVTEGGATRKQAATDEDPPAAAAVTPKVKSPAVAPGKKTAAKEVRPHWDAFLEYVMDRIRWMALCLRRASVSENEGELILDYDDVSDCRLLQSTENMKSLTEFAQDFFQKELAVRFMVRGFAPGDEQDTAEASPKEDRRALAGETLVRMTMEIMDGEIANIRTGPRSR